MSNFAAIVFRTFMCKFSPFPDHFYSVETSLQKASQPDLDASVCIAKFGFFCLSDLQFFNPKFSTHQRSAPVLTGCLILTPTGTNKPVLVIVFVVVVNALVVDEMVELLGELLTSDLSILLIPKQ